MLNYQLPQYEVIYDYGSFVFKRTDNPQENIMTAFHSMRQIHRHYGHDSVLKISQTFYDHFKGFNERLVDDFNHDEEEEFKLFGIRTILDKDLETPFELSITTEKKLPDKVVLHQSLIHGGRF